MTIPNRTNPYHSSYEVVLTLNDPNAHYSFDTYIVARSKQEDPCSFETQYEYFWAHDSGCSCPTPFDDAKTYSLTEKTYGILHDEVSKRTNYDDEPFYGPETPEFLAATIRLLKGL